MGTFIQDLKYGFRVLRKRPAFASIAVLALALGIGANSAIFSVVNAVLLRPMPYGDLDRLVMLWDTHKERNIPVVEVSYPNFLDWQKQSQTFEHMAALPSVNLGLTLTGQGEPQQLESAIVSPNFFSVVQSAPMIGRNFNEKDNQTGAEPVVVISNGLWKRTFGGDPGVIGRQVTLDGGNATVIGVMAPEFDFPKGVDVWTPIATDPEGWTNLRDFRVLRVVGRMKSGITLEQAQAEMSTIAQRLGQQYPEANQGYGIVLFPLVEQMFGDARPAMFVLTGAVALVLLLACANVANLLLARVVERSRETAIRTALGADRGRLVRQFLAESLIIALLGGALGLLLAKWFMPVLTSLIPADIPRIENITVDWQVVLFTVFISVATALLFGLAPAFHSAQIDVNESLKEGSGKSSAGAGSNRLRNLLVSSQVAFALILLIGSALLFRSLWKLQSLDPGYETVNTLSFQIALPQSKYTNKQLRADFFQQALERIRNIPGVESAGSVLMRPLSGTVGWDLSFTVEGQSEEDAKRNTASNWQVISPGYIETAGIKLGSGRVFTEADDAKAPPVAIISENMAKRFWPGEDAVGKRIKIGKPTPQTPWTTIVGVTAPARYREWGGHRFDIYVPLKQGAQFRTDFVVKTKVEPYGVLSAIRNEIYAIDKDQPLTEITTMKEVVSAALARPRFNLILLGVFAALALLLAVMGVYGVVSYSVTQRTRDIGIRMALGASRGKVLRLVIGESMRWVGLGLAVGIVVALALTRVVESLLYEVSPTDPLTFASITVVLALIGLTAGYFPAKRATRIDPIIALRYE